jgi:carboxypeptidase C (cathepsin A)
MSSLIAMLSLLIISILILLPFLDAVDYTSEAEADRVINLPGAETIDISFAHFSGYLDVKGTTTNESIHLHYWLVESAYNSTNDPLLLWTNGGPGCSGLLGFLSELGPFFPNADGSLSLNPYAWNKQANLLFIESPCGVGFSYSEASSDYVANDNSTAKLNYDLIQAFFERFPHFRTNDFYLSSESYGGHYIPTLASLIVSQNEVESPFNLINLKGFLVGNPYTDTYSAFPSMLETFFGHSLIPKPFFEAYKTQCAHVITTDDQSSGVYEACSSFVDQMLEFVGGYSPYALDFDVCPLAASSAGVQQRQLLRHALSRRLHKDSKLRSKLESTGVFDYCEDSYLDKYLNSADVKTALHVNQNVQWTECSQSLTWEWEDYSTAPLYNQLLEVDDMHILVYSGNDDAVCSTLGTQTWIFNLGLTTTSGKSL